MGSCVRRNLFPVVHFFCEYIFHCLVVKDTWFVCAVEWNKVGFINIIDPLWDEVKNVEQV
jgi:hypothetical protein